MATHSTVTRFQPGKDDWSTYIEQLNFYFIANGVTDAAKKKRSILLANCGSAAFKLIRGLLEEGKMEATSYEDLMMLVRNYYQPNPSIILS
jgi:hypothetical protein